MKTPTSTKKLLFASSRVWVPSAAFLSLLLMPIVPINAQGSNQRETHAIVGTSTNVEDLIVTVTWKDSVTAEWFEIAVFDENDLQVAGQLVWPRPGEQVQTTFDNFLHNLRDSGFQFSAAVRDSAGGDVSQRHAFRVVLECSSSMEPCQWATQDGLYTNALAISEPLMAALDALETRRSSNLLEDVLEEHPDLRGPVFSLAAQIDRLDQQMGLKNECICAWHHSSIQIPDQQDCSESGPGQLPPDRSGWELVEIKGEGANAIVAGQVRDFPMSFIATETGESQQTMALICWKIHDWVERADLPLLPSPDMPPQATRFPIVEACPDSCRGAVESSATIGYKLSTRVHEPEPSSNLARARVVGSLEKDDGVNLPQDDTREARLQWFPGDTYVKQQGGSIQIPAEGVVDSNIRRMTTTLSGRATVTVQAVEDKAWSFATAYFTGAVLQAEGHADCAILPTREAELGASGDRSRTTDCGEPLINPWEEE